MTDELTADQLLAAANIVVGVLLLAAGLLLTLTAYRARAPWSMMAASTAVLLLVSATFTSSLARFFLVPNAPIVLVTLRIAALILLTAAVWQLWDHRRGVPR